MGHEYRKREILAVQGRAEPAPQRPRIPLGMGKVLGGGSSINAMIWARGHKSDWDFFVSESGHQAWGYESVLDTYRRIEDWQGAPDPRYRGTGGPVFVQPLQRDPTPAVRALFEGIRSLGIPIFENQNGRIMEADGGASGADMRIRDGRRQSVFRTYVFPHMDQPNLTLLPHALVTRLTFEGNRTTGVEISYEGSTRRIRAGREVILSLGAIHTPKVLMQLVSATRPNCGALESRWSNISREWDAVFKTILLFAVSGIVRNRYLPISCQTRSYTGRVKLV